MFPYTKFETVFCYYNQYLAKEIRNVCLWKNTLNLYKIVVPPLCQKEK